MKYNFNDIKESFKDGGSITSRLLMNYISSPFIYFFSNFTKITPNQITLIGFIIGLIASFSFFSKEFIYGIVLFELSYIFDCIDGRLARLTNQTSKLGDMYDHVFGQLLIIILTIPFLFHFYHLSMFKEILLLVFFIFLSPFNYFLNYYSKYTFIYKKNNSLIKEEEIDNNFIKKLHIYLKKKGMKSIPSDTEAIHIMFVIVPLMIYCNYYNLIFIAMFLANLIFLLDIIVTIYRNIKLNKLHFKE